MKPFNRFAACVGSLALLALGSTSASALSTWDFTSPGEVVISDTELLFGFIPIPIPASKTFISTSDGKPIVVDAFTLAGTAENPLEPFVTQNFLTQAPGGLGVGALAQALDAVPDSNVYNSCGFVCRFFGGSASNTSVPPAVDVLRLSLVDDSWFAKEIAISDFGNSESVQLFGGNLASGLDAELLNEVVGDDLNDPDIFALDDSNAFQFFFIAAVANFGDCPIDETGLCGSPSSVRIASFTGQQIPEPGALALVGMGLVGLAMVRRRRKVAA